MVKCHGNVIFLDVDKDADADGSGVNDVSAIHQLEQKKGAHTLTHTHKVPASNQSVGFTGLLLVTIFWIENWFVTLFNAFSQAVVPSWCT